MERLRLEKKNQIKGGIYHKLMIDLTFHSNHMEGNELTHDETRYIFETRTIGIEKNTSKKVDDILETMNHFAAIDRVIDFANYPLSEAFIKELHKILAILDSLIFLLAIIRRCPMKLAVWKLLAQGLWGPK